MRALALCALGTLMLAAACSPPGQHETKKKSGSGAAEKIAEAAARKPVLEAHPEGVVYVLCSGDDTLLMFDRASLATVGKPVKTGREPGSIVLSPSGKLYFPARWMDDNELTRTTAEGAIRDEFRRKSLWGINPAEGNAIAMKGFAGDLDADLDPVFVSLTPDGNWAAVSDQATNRVHFRDLGDGEHRRNREIEAGPGPFGSAFSPDGRYFVVANNDPQGTTDPDSVIIVDFLGNDDGPVEIARIPVGDRPSQIAAAPDNATFYVTVTGSGRVVAVSATAKGVVGDWQIGGQPQGITRNSEGTAYYITLQDSAEVVRVDPASGEVTGRGKTGQEPWMVILDEGMNRIWVTCRAEGAVSVLKLADLTLERTIKAGKQPTGLVLLPGNTPATAVAPQPEIQIQGDGAPITIQAAPQDAAAVDDALGGG